MPPETEHTVWSAPYSEQEVDALVDLIAQAGGAPASGTALTSAIMDLVVAAGRHMGGDPNLEEFEEWAARGPTHAALARTYDAIAEAADPHATGLIKGIVRSEIRALARVSSAARSHEIPEPSAHRVREIALQLATYHRSFVRRGPKTKTAQDTIIFGLAQIFVEFAALDISTDDLPHAPSSVFVRFAHVAMRPFFPLTEASVQAISHAWTKMKGHPPRRGRPKPK